MKNAFDLRNETVKEISNMIHYIGVLACFGLYDTMDLFLLRVRRDASVTMMIGLLRTASMFHRAGKLRYWRRARDRIYEELERRNEPDIEQEMIGLMDI